jgi:hypothetical protein
MNTPAPYKHCRCNSKANAFNYARAASSIIVEEVL